MQQEVRDDDNFFKRLRNCAFVSFALLCAATALHLPPWVGMLGGGAPLVYYHLGYLTRRASKGLSQTAIDSVYYFGFLVTVAALGVSAVSLAATGGKAPLTDIAFQFGLGLLATGYAVIARLHLTSIGTLVEEANPEAVLDKYVARSRELVTNVEMASEQFVTLSNNLMRKSEEVATASQAATQSVMLEMARLFDEQLRGTLASARDGLTEIRGLVRETSFVQEREALVRGVKDTLEAVTKLNGALDQFAQRAGEGARTSESVTATSKALNETLVAFHSQLEKVSGPNGQLLAAADSVAEANIRVAEGTRSMGEIVAELGDMANAVKGVGTTFKNIKTLTTKANEQLDALVVSSERLEGASNHISKTADATSRLAEGLDRTARSLPELEEAIDDLGQRFDGLKTAVAGVESDIQRLPRPAAEVARIGDELTGTLETVARVLAAASIDAQAIAANASQNADAIERTNKAAADTSSLSSASEALQRILTDLTANIERLQTTLNASTSSLSNAMGAATASLEGDVKRSADVAHLFGERMTNVAQIIIDRTRDGRPV